MTSIRCLELAISKDNLNDLVARYLYTLGYLNKDEEISGIELNFKNTQDETIPLKVTFGREIHKKEVTVTATR